MQDTLAMMALRGMMRNRLSMREDLGVVMIAAVKRARVDRVTDEQLQKVTEDLRGEGLIPSFDKSTET